MINFTISTERIVSRRKGYTSAEIRTERSERKLNGTDILSRIKARLSEMVGEKVYITANHGRRKRTSLAGVLEGTYTSLFTVLVPGTPETRLSFTYCDVLTRAVIVQPIRTPENTAAIS
jgi:uncharacterized protein Veg